MVLLGGCDATLSAGSDASVLLAGLKCGQCSCSQAPIWSREARFKDCDPPVCHGRWQHWTVCAIAVVVALLCAVALWSGTARNGLTMHFATSHAAPPAFRWVPPRGMWRTTLASASTPATPAARNVKAPKVRLDDLLVRLHPQYSKNVIQSFIATGKVYINDQQVLKAGTQVREGVCLRVCVCACHWGMVPLFHNPHGVAP